MDFRSVKFDTCWKSFGFFSASWVTYNEDALHMISVSVTCWDALSQVENFKSIETFIKIQKPWGGFQ